MLDLAITWLPLIGTLVVGSGVTIWFGLGSKSLAIWAGFAGLVILALGFCLNLQKVVWDTEPKTPNGPTDAEIIAQRAYITVDSYELQMEGAGEKIRFNFTSTNRGQTPAYDAHFFGIVKVLPYPLPKGFTFNPASEETTRSKTIIPRDGSQRGHKDAEAPLTRSEFAAILDGSKFRLYFTGVVRYNDAFKKPRETWFCVSAGGPPLAALTKSGASIRVDASDIFAFCDVGRETT
jgi:hypothetical protein